MSGFWCCFGRRRFRTAASFEDVLDNGEVMRYLQEETDSRPAPLLTPAPARQKSGPSLLPGAQPEHIPAPRLLPEELLPGEPPEDLAASSPGWGSLASDWSGLDTGFLSIPALDCVEEPPPQPQLQLRPPSVDTFFCISSQSLPHTFHSYRSTSRITALPSTSSTSPSTSSTSPSTSCQSGDMTTSCQSLLSHTSTPISTSDQVEKSSNETLEGKSATAEEVSLSRRPSLALGHHCSLTSPLLPPPPTPTRLSSRPGLPGTPLSHHQTSLTRLSTSYHLKSSTPSLS